MEENKSKPSLADGWFESKPKGCGHKNKVPKPQLQRPPIRRLKRNTTEVEE